MSHESVGDPPAVESFRFGVQQFVTDMLVTEKFVADLDVSIKYAAHRVAHHLVAIHKVPAKVLQNGEVVAEWPDGLWQTIRQKLRLPYRSKRLHVREIVTFPSVALPRGMDHRIVFESWQSRSNA